MVKVQTHHGFRKCTVPRLMPSRITAIYMEASTFQMKHSCLNISDKYGMYIRVATPTLMLCYYKIEIDRAVKLTFINHIFMREWW